MKRNWLQIIAIGASLVAGTICSTALADNKGGNKFQGGNFRIHGGGSNNGGGSLNSVRKITSGQPAIKTQQFGGGNGGNGGNGLSGIKIGNTPKFTRDIKTMPNLGGNQPQFTQKRPQLGIDKHIGIGGHSPKIDINKKIGIQTPKFDVNKKIGIGIGKPNFDLHDKVKIGGNVPKIVDPKFCQPPKGCNPKWDPCHDKCQPHCYPWWWSPCTYNPCYKPCQTIYYTQPVVYTVPVAVPVATTTVGSPVVQAGAVVEESLMQVPSGATLTLQGQELGGTPGQVILQIDKISMPVQINDWKPEAVNATLPMLGVAEPVRAQIWLVRADGSVGANVSVQLIPAQAPQSAEGVGAAVGSVDAGNAAAALFGEVR